MNVCETGIQVYFVNMKIYEWVYYTKKKFKYDLPFTVHPQKIQIQNV
jgi:hypothetical protein